MMLQLVQLNVILLTIFVLRSEGIRIRGSPLYTYDPSNPSTTTLTCETDDGDSIRDATWKRDGELVDSKFVQSNGRLAMNRYTIGTEDPQSVEGLYRCESGNATSDLVAFFGKTSLLFLDARTCMHI